MKTTLCFATNNAHKLEEIQAILGDSFELISLAETGCTEELPETGNTLEANSLQKAQYLYDHYQVNCFADDSGLEVEALEGEPGVDSAHLWALLVAKQSFVFIIFHVKSPLTMKGLIF